MLDEHQQVLYVGKAKNLQNRLSSYFRNKGLNNKTLALVAKIHSIELTITPSESEALLLEHSLIKKHRPPYNILLIDGKSYPYLLITTAHASPGIFFHRGAKKQAGKYFGPFANVVAVRESLQLLMQGFRLRNCEDSVFAHRTRPCLQYQIKRCSAPCVAKISAEDYQQDVAAAIAFLEGKNDQLLAELEARMQQHSAALRFEDAAKIRDQIAFLHRVRDKQWVISEQQIDADVFALAMAPGGCCLSYLMIRKGQLLGSRSFFPSGFLASQQDDLLLHVLSQFYLANERADLPSEVLLPSLPDNMAMLEQAIRQQYNKNIVFKTEVREPRAQWLSMALNNAQEQLRMELSKKESMQARFSALQEQLRLPSLSRIECFDISHTQGQDTRASCVVFTKDGPDTRAYRTLKITGVTPGDDYAAMAQAIEKRIASLQKGSQPLPDIILVDGGKGQFAVAEQALQAVKCRQHVALLAIAKGVTRKPGLEQLYWQSVDNLLSIEPASPAMHLLQHLRDEAHRVAISDHRRARAKKTVQSTLDGIANVGPRRKRALIQHFGSVSAIRSASVAQIMQVKGINKSLAESIHQYLQDY